MPVVLITGASSGIGAATARRLGRAGMVVVLAGRRADEMATVARDIEANGGTAVVVPTDVRNADDIAALVDRAARRRIVVPVRYRSAILAANALPAATDRLYAARAARR
jgi:NADP-dependent 3-hydroxy acid dehydrogenase YdfG